MENVETVSSELIGKIRGHINRVEKQALLLKDLPKWLRLTAALDVLEDTSWAIEYYCETPYPDNRKGMYLYTYGLLQALFLQQDAIAGVSVSLFDERINFKMDYPSAYKVRELRNDVVGHPTYRDNKYFIYLAQHSLSKDGFYYMKDNSEDGSYESIDVDISSAISDTALCVNDILSKSLDRLDKDFRSYIDSHRARKMAAIFNSLMYIKAKALENKCPRNLVYAETRDMIQKCEAELELRYGSVNAVDSYKELLDSIHHVYNLIQTVIPQCPFEVQEQLEYALLENLFAKLEELQQYCKETDDYFENYGEV